jgi:hypothetical protein
MSVQKSAADLILEIERRTVEKIRKDSRETTVYLPESQKNGIIFGHTAGSVIEQCAATLRRLKHPVINCTMIRMVSDINNPAVPRNSIILGMYTVQGELFCFQDDKLINVFPFVPYICSHSVQNNVCVECLPDNQELPACMINILEKKLQGTTTSELNSYTKTFSKVRSHLSAMRELATQLNLFVGYDVDARVSRAEELEASNAAEFKRRSNELAIREHHLALMISKLPVEAYSTQVAGAVVVDVLNAPGSTPDHVPTPASSQGATPSTAPVAARVTTPVTAPVTAPVAAPVAARVTTPVTTPIAATVAVPVPARTPSPNVSASTGAESTKRQRTSPP